MTRYRTIVVDPPWDQGRTGLSLEGGGSLTKGEDWSGKTRGTGVPYSCMTIAEIRALPISSVADVNAHLYLWTTNRYLRFAYDIASVWGFHVSIPLVWCKSPRGFMGGAFTSSAEFILFCRRGNLAAQTRIGRQWFEWPRTAHSAKPDAFYDMVEQVSPGPYLELFARRARFGWDYWGDESLSTVELGSYE